MSGALSLLRQMLLHTACLMSSRFEQVAFVLLDDPDNAEMIAWTTTPWRAAMLDIHVCHRGPWKFYQASYAWSSNLNFCSEGSYTQAQSSALSEPGADSWSNALPLAQACPLA